MRGCIETQSHPCNTERCWVVAANDGVGSGGCSISVFSGGEGSGGCSILMCSGGGGSGGCSISLVSGGGYSFGLQWREKHQLTSSRVKTLQPLTP